jgi:hypothetical protein
MIHDSLNEAETSSINYTKQGPICQNAEFKSLLRQTSLVSDSSSCDSSNESTSLIYNHMYNRIPDTTFLLIFMQKTILEVFYSPHPVSNLRHKPNTCRKWSYITNIDWQGRCLFLEQFISSSFAI